MYTLLLYALGFALVIYHLEPSWSPANWSPITVVEIQIAIYLIAIAVELALLVDVHTDFARFRAVLEDLVETETETNQ